MAEGLQKQQQDLGREEELLQFLPQVSPFPPPPTGHSQPNNSNYNHQHLDSYVNKAASCMETQDNLFRAFADLPFTERIPPPPERFSIMPTPNTQPLRTVDQRYFPGPLPDQSCDCMLWTKKLRRQGADLSGYGAVPSYQAEYFIGETTRTPQAIKYNCWLNRATKNMAFPFRFREGGFGRGTGVYLPRTPATISSTAAKHIDHPSKKTGARRRHDNEAEFLENEAHKKSQEDSSEPEVCLPEDWPY